MGDALPVCLMTDFGTQDPYVGLMKAVLQADVPYPPVIDLTHEIPPQDEQTAAFLLEYVLPDCPDDAIVVLVVDPGVGTDRDILAVETQKGRRIVAPDTGMVDGLDLVRARKVANRTIARETISSTFHGRDWFAPVGRYLSLGGDFSELGPDRDVPSSDGLVPDPVAENSQIRGEILHVDRFGNLITNVKPADVQQALGVSSAEYGRVTIDVAESTIDGIIGTYGRTDSLTGVIGSFDRVEIALPGGSAREALDVGRGTGVRLYRSRS